ncbi:hypothetical protein XI09_42510 [Bradyrhizobium sp. CCBAU 11386]|uniref:hypothetical protein n=1 Tax=Bradyrhizobium sp. CCBAU 11386 TaxID=1630837 RepID=UPI0023026E0B|nr:hypothetical protein [Bradyrhizobium sp. CCBAU 11386]MDA9511215.1 hypothetical protein [Bradyrhizobium sp. CCBAU 11386]
MRIAFVHGINNEQNKPETIEQSWWEALERGWKAAGLVAKPRPDITVAYYADLLAGLTKSDAVEMGTPTISTGFAVGLLQEYANAAGVTNTELAEAALDLNLPQEAVAQGVPHEGWIISFASILERILPTKGKLIAHLFLRQAVIYIDDKVLAVQIDKRVTSAIFGDQLDPVIVIAHSLGSVVSYRVLAGATQRDVPLFVTLGSPLGVNMFKSILPPRGTMPKPPIGHWFNARHEDDFVTLGRAILEKSIGFGGVEDSTDIVGDDPDRHSIAQYLSSPVVAKMIHQHL